MAWPKSWFGPLRLTPPTRCCRSSIPPGWPIRGKAPRCPPPQQRDGATSRGWTRLAEYPYAGGVPSDRSDELATMFRETARKRITEAQHLLTLAWAKPSRATYDGAVACSLLAAECALKAALLWGHGCNSVKDYADDPGRPCFSGAAGHQLLLLLDRQANDLVRQWPPPRPAAERLGGCGRYRYRYGMVRPSLLDATPLVGAAEEIVRWMMQVFK
jgi:hypothetical protein